MSEFENIARDADTIAQQPEGPVSHRDLSDVLKLIARLARAAHRIPIEIKRPVGRPPKVP